jgi:hypothetical protein
MSAGEGGQHHGEHVMLALATIAPFYARKMADISSGSATLK